MIDGIRTLPAGAEIRGIPVEYADKSNWIALAKGIWPLKRIVVGPKWFDLAAPEQAAVLMHEVHHCRACHFEIRLLLLPFLWTKWAQRIACQQELDADGYAVSQGYAQEMVKIAWKYPLSFAPFHPSPLERLNHLIKLGAAS